MSGPFFHPDRASAGGAAGTLFGLVPLPGVPLERYLVWCRCRGCRWNSIWFGASPSVLRGCHQTEWRSRRAPSGVTKRDSVPAGDGRVGRSSNTFLRLPRTATLPLGRLRTKDRPIAGALELRMMRGEKGVQGFGGYSVNGGWQTTASLDSYRHSTFTIGKCICAGR